MNPAQLAEKANAAARESRRGGAPKLSADSDVETLSAWLQWCDPNGCHTADLAAVEDFDPYTVDAAWDAVDDMVQSS
jgi:hypothetical protein